MIKLNYKTILISLFIVSLLITFNFSFFTKDSIYISSSINDNKIKLNQQDIDIISPENKTYAKPMSGYYPGIYGFENEINGATSTDIAFVDLDDSASICYGEIIASIGDHNKLLKVYDGNLAGVYSLYNNLKSIQESGSIEYWIYTPDAAYVNALQLHDSTETRVFIRISHDNFQYRLPSMAFYNICIALDNTWYHVRVDFECGNGGYMGLAADTFYIWINNTQYGPYDFTLNSVAIERVRLASNYDQSGATAYYDAIGYSWDSSYDIGDNLMEGLRLIFTSDFDADWLGYSLDKQSNITILGDTTIPFPLNGTHSIQLYGNDTIGTLYESDIRYFTIGPLPPSSKPDIPGYSLLIIISVISIISIILIKKQKIKI
ncbi:MAG: hypothetical protein ACFFA6_01455 [Promethearchaeota archaeon]